MKYNVVRTDTADEQIRQIILHINENFGSDTALEKLEELEKSLMLLGEYPDMGTVPRYHILRRQGYMVLILEKNLVFYRIDDKKRQVIIYAAAGHKQDYLNIIRGL